MDTQPPQEDLRAAELAQARQEGDEASEEKVKNEGKRLSLFAFVCFLIFFLILDAIDFFTVGTVGWVIGLIGDGIAWYVLHQNKTNREQYRKILIGMFGDTIPVLSTLPLRSIVLVWTYIFP